MPDDQQSPPKKRKIPPIVATFAVAAASISGSLVLYRLDVQPRTYDAEVLANYIGIAPVVDGPIVKLAVHDNQLVKQGDLLFEIDDAPYRYALENAKSQQEVLEGQIANERKHIASQASAALAAAAAARSAQAGVMESEASISEARADINHSEAALKQAIAEWQYSDNNLHRLEPLLRKQFVTADQVDQARSMTRARDETVRQAEAQVVLSKARLASALAQEQQSRSSLEQSDAQASQSRRAINLLSPLLAQRGSRASQVRNAQYNFEHCRVYAPFEARVTNMTIAQGAFARAGQQLFVLIDTRTWWVVANFRETQLKNVLPGMAADVFLMSRPDEHFQGVVDSTAYGVTFDPTVLGTLTQQGLPDAQRTLNWVHLASRYPVRVRVLHPVSDLLRIGENAAVIVRGGQARVPRR